MLSDIFILRSFAAKQYRIAKSQSNSITFYWCKLLMEEAREKGENEIYSSGRIAIIPLDISLYF